jgi:hypothetical protein
MSDYTDDIFQSNGQHHPADDDSLGGSRPFAYTLDEQERIMRAMKRAELDEVLRRSPTDPILDPDPFEANATQDTQRKHSPRRGVDDSSASSECPESPECPVSPVWHSAADSEFFQAVMERVASSPLPQVAGQFFDSKIRLLISICQVLQEAAGQGRAFYLAYRTAGKLIGVADPKKVQRWMLMLCRRGVLDQVSRGIPGRKSTTASEWRYIGD